MPKLYITVYLLQQKANGQILFSYLIQSLCINLIHPILLDYWKHLLPPWFVHFDKLWGHYIIKILCRLDFHNYDSLHAKDLRGIFLEHALQLISLRIVATFFYVPSCIRNLLVWEIRSLKIFFQLVMSHLKESVWKSPSEFLAR